MKRIRIIPVLLYESEGLIKTQRFKSRKYVGDPINAIKIFNQKEVDELIFLDIEATYKKNRPNLSVIHDIATECFMPLCYGGNVSTLQDIKSIFHAGVEKVCIGTAAFHNPKLIQEAAHQYGSQSIVVSVDVKKIKAEFRVFVQNGTIDTGFNVLDYVKKMEMLGAGELMVQSIDKDGTQLGYDLDLIHLVSNSVNIPVIACGGAKTTYDFKQAILNGASAVAAGSMFVFYGKHQAVLINTPTEEERENLQNELVN